MIIDEKQLLKPDNPTEIELKQNLYSSTSFSIFIKPKRKLPNGLGLSLSLAHA
jgi:hypothetical protein